MYGTRDGMDGQEAIYNSLGPMSRSIEDLEVWSKAVLEGEPWMGADPKCLPVPWRNVTVPKKLCLGEFAFVELQDHITHSRVPGILLDDGIVKPLPPVTRALAQIRAALEAAGHNVIEVQM